MRESLDSHSLKSSTTNNTGEYIYVMYLISLEHIHEMSDIISENLPPLLYRMKDNCRRTCHSISHAGVPWQTHEWKPGGNKGPFHVLMPVLVSSGTRIFETRMDTSTGSPSFRNTNIIDDRERQRRLSALSLNMHYVLRIPLDLCGRWSRDLDRKLLCRKLSYVNLCWLLLLFVLKRTGRT